MRTTQLRQTMLIRNVNGQACDSQRCQGRFAVAAAAAAAAESNLHAEHRASIASLSLS